MGRIMRHTLSHDHTRRVILFSVDICRRESGESDPSEYFLFFFQYASMTNSHSLPDTLGDETESILSRTKAMLPELESPETEILAAFAGLRPSREGGVRVASEVVQVDDSGRKGLVVHNYGAGGTGFQAGYGMAVDAVGCALAELEKLQVTKSSL
jgi:hypothetical protein